MSDEIMIEQAKAKLWADSNFQQERRSFWRSQYEGVTRKDEFEKDAAKCRGHEVAVETADKALQAFDRKFTTP